MHTETEQFAVIKAARAQWTAEHMRNPTGNDSNSPEEWTASWCDQSLKVQKDRNSIGYVWFINGGNPGGPEPTIDTAKRCAEVWAQQVSLCFVPALPFSAKYTQYEYMSFGHMPGDNLERVKDTLNEYGQNGWVVCSVIRDHLKDDEIDQVDEWFVYWLVRPFRPCGNREQKSAGCLRTDSRPVPPTTRVIKEGQLPPRK